MALDVAPVLGGLALLRGSLVETAGVAESSAQRVAASRTSIEQDTEKLQTGARRSLQEFEEENVGRLERLQKEAARFNSIWSESIGAALELFKDGQLSFQELLRQFGEDRLTLEGEIVTVREALKGIDPNLARNRVQELRQVLEEGKNQVQAILGELRQTQNQWAQELADLFERFQRTGEGLEELLAKAQQLQASFGPNSGIGTAAGGILEVLGSGNAQGTL